MTSLNEDKIRSETILEDDDSRKDQLQADEQAWENRRFDKLLVLHGEKISNIEKNLLQIQCLEKRIRKLESFKFILVGIGVVIPLLIRFLFFD